MTSQQLSNLFNTYGYLGPKVQKRDRGFSKFRSRQKGPFLTLSGGSPKPKLILESAWYVVDRFAHPAKRITWDDCLRNAADEIAQLLQE